MNGVAVLGAVEVDVPTDNSSARRIAFSSSSSYNFISYK
jgi:hypothetical protein